MSESPNKSINTLCRVTKYFGLFPFNLSADGSLKISTFWLTWSTILFGLLSAGAIWTTYVDSNLDSEDKHIMREIIFVTVLFSSKNITAISFLILHIIWLFINRRKLESAFKLLMKTEGEVPKLTGRWRQIITYVLVLISIASELFPDWFYTLYIVTSTLVDLVPSALKFAALYQFTDLLQVCRYHFRKVNSTFGELKSATETLSSKSRKSTLLEQCKKNNELIACCETLNYCFGPLLLISVINCFAEVSTSLFVMYHYWSYFENGRALYISIWILLFFNIFRYLLASCENTVNKANEFYDNLAETLLNYDGLSNEQCFLVSLISRKTLKFTAFGFFTIDYGMFFSIIAASITYFLVFIEFNSLSVETKANRNATAC